MIQFSIPAALSVFAATSAVAVTSVAVALPALQPTEVISATASPTVTVSPTPTPTAVSGGGDSPLSAYPDHVLMGGVHLHDLQMGFTTHVMSSGVLFTYVGECVGDRPIFTIWGNNGQIKSTGGGYCQAFTSGQVMYAGTGLTWNEDTRNSYCYSPLGGASAYRAEIYGMYSEWVPIPEEFKQCVNEQAPEGPLPPGEVAPFTPPVPAEPAPAPSSSDSSSPTPSVSSTP